MKWEMVYLNEEWLINDLKTIIFLQILSKLLMHDMIHLMSSNQFVLNVDKKMTYLSKASLVILKSKRPFNCSNYYKFQTCLKMVKLGGNSWSSGYSRRLILQRSWVPILAPYTGWTFFTFICCKICNLCLKRHQ